MQRSTALSLIDAIIEGVLNDRIKIHRILDEQVHPKMNKNTNITPKISIDEKVSNQDDGWNQSNSMQRSTALSLIDAIIEGVLNDRIKIHRILDEQVHPKMNKNTNITPKISIDEKVSNQDDGWNQLSDTHISGSIPGSMSS